MTRCPREESLPGILILMTRPIPDLIPGFMMKKPVLSGAEGYCPDTGRGALRHILPLS